MNKNDLEEILNSYKWIKIENFKDVKETNENYIKLMGHHIKETEFLIDFCRKLAAENLESQDCKLTALLIKHTIGTWKSEGVSFGLTQEEDKELLEMLLNYPGNHLKFVTDLYKVNYGKKSKN